MDGCHTVLQVEFWSVVGSSRAWCEGFGIASWFRSAVWLVSITAVDTGRPSLSLSL